jgi:hypothetical protein
LALTLNRIDEAFEIALKASDSVEKFKWIGDIALKVGNFELAERSFDEAKDFNSLFLIYSCSGEPEKLEKLGN